MNHENESTYKYHVIGIHFSKDDGLPMLFVESALKHLDKDVQLTIFTNFKSTKYDRYDKRLKLITVDAVCGSQYERWKKLAESSSGQRWYRYFALVMRWLAILHVRFEKQIPSFILSFLFTRYAVHVARFFVYWNHQLTHKIDKCLYSDLADVVFQENFFNDDRISGHGIFAFEERDDTKIQDETHNNAWVSKLYFDHPGLSSMLNSVICCSGTIITSGSRELKRFMKMFCLHQLTPRMYLYPPGPRASGNEFGMTNGHNPADQGVFNYLTNEFPNIFTRIPNGNIVYTMGTEREGDFEVIDGKIRKVGVSGVPAVVHQYNRHQNIDSHIKAMYGAIPN